jgi:hypothetical protein
MRILDHDTITVIRHPGNHRQILSIETKGGELLGVELTDDEVAQLVERLTAPAPAERSPDSELTP